MPDPNNPNKTNTTKPSGSKRPKSTSSAASRIKQRKNLRTKFSGKAKGRNVLKDSYKHILYTMLHENKDSHIGVDEFVQHAYDQSSLTPEEMGTVIHVEHGDRFTNRDFIWHHAKMLHGALVDNDKRDIERHSKALGHHKVNVEALIKLFKKS